MKRTEQQMFEDVFERAKIPTVQSQYDEGENTLGRPIYVLDIPSLQVNLTFRQDNGDLLGYTNYNESGKIMEVYLAERTDVRVR
jgi:hypothetical protein